MATFSIVDHTGVWRLFFYCVKQSKQEVIQDIRRMCRVLVNFCFGDNSREHPGDPRASLVWQLGALGAADVLIRSFLSSKTHTHTHLCTRTAIIVRTLVNMMHSNVEPLSLALATSHPHPHANRETNS